VQVEVIGAVGDERGIDLAENAVHFIGTRVGAGWRGTNRGRDETSHLISAT
jgi:hypothetical protein